MLLTSQTKFYNLAICGEPYIPVKEIQGLLVNNALSTHVVDNVASFVERDITFGQIVLAFSSRDQVRIVRFDATIQVDLVVVKV